MATACDLADVETPDGLDSISFLPTLKGQANSQAKHEYLYWEFYERGGRRAVRVGNWKAVRPLWNAEIELYELSRDVGESKNVATQHSDVVTKMAALMEEAHTTSPDWPVPGTNRGN